MLQPINPLYYVIAGDPLTLNCTATNDPQSPNNLRFRWFKESTRINNNDQLRRTITELSLSNTFTVTSQLVITNLVVEQHNGTYTCSVDNFKIRTSVDQTTLVIIESKLLRIALLIYTGSLIIIVLQFLLLLLPILLQQ